MQPVLVHLGSFSLYSFGVFIALAFAAGGYVTYRLAKQAGLSTAGFIDYFLVCAVAGLLGARLWHLIFRPFEVGSVWEIFSLWGGGLALQGGLVAAAIGFWLILRRNHQPIWRWFDVATIGLLVGLVVGKLGSFLNGDSFGDRSSLPWAVRFNDPLAPASVMGGPIHPLQLYAALVYAGAAYYLWRRFRRDRAKGSYRDGTIFLLGILLISVIQFGLEFWHASIDAMYLSGIRVVSVVAVIGLVFALVMLTRRRRPA